MAARPTPTLKSLIDKIPAKEHARLSEITCRLIELKVEEQERKAEADPLKTELRAFYAVYDLRKLRIEDWTIRENRGRRTTKIEATRLADLGVPATVIAQATRTTTGEDYIEIEQDKERKESDGTPQE